MKQIIHISFLIILLIVGGCSSDNSNNTNLIESEKNLDLNSLVIKYNMDPESHVLDGSFFKSNVDFGINDEQLMLLVGNEGDYATAFNILMNELLLDKFSTMKAGEYEVAYLFSDLILKTDNEIFYFTTSDKPAYAHLISVENTYNVNGLINHNDFDHKGSKDEIFLKSDASCICVHVLDQNPPSCQSGGKGSNSCSIFGEGGCNVSCGSSYYACCNS